MHCEIPMVTQRYMMPAEAFSFPQTQNARLGRNLKMAEALIITVFIILLFVLPIYYEL